MVINWAPALLVVAALCPRTASAGVEVGGTAGAHLFSDTSELGVDDLPDAQSPRNSLLLGLRIGAFFGDVLGVEGELGLIPTVARELGYGVTSLTYRAHLVAQLRAGDPDARAIPFFVIGGGALSVVASSANSPTDRRQIQTDTDAIVYLGAGIKYRGGRAWGVRADARLIVGPSTENPEQDPDTSRSGLDFEFLVSGYFEIGRKQHALVPPPPPPDDDPDKDGLRGAADRCPDEPEDRDGFQDDDGCVDPDNDGDQVADANDRCPGEIEDRDGFQDDDGCPDPDNDGDHIADANDRCPGEAENVNSYQDDDGCPDSIPRPTLDQIMKGFTDRILFEYDKAVLTEDSIRVIGEIATLLKATPEIELLSLEGHSSRDGEARHNEKLSQQRAQVAADALIAAGIDARRLQVLHFGAKVPAVPGRHEAQRRLSRRVEFKVVKFTSPAAPAPAASL